MVPIAHLSTGPIALVLPGEAMWGAFQTGFTMELGARLQATGHGPQPFAVAIGSSSGSLVATAAAAGAPFDHDFAQNVWVEYGCATELRLSNRPLNPFPAALQSVFDRGLVDTERAFCSRTHLIVTATRLSVGRQPLAARYFTNKPDYLPNDDWIFARSSWSLTQAVKASSRIPVFYGAPILYGADVYIDGVFANNAPVELALMLGAQHVFVVTSSQKGLVFDRPVQSLVRRGLKTALNGLRWGRGIDSSVPVDVDDLRRRYPKQQVHVVHPKRAVKVKRFSETRPEVFRTLYDMGREEASNRYDVIFSSSSTESSNGLAAE